MGTLYRDRGFLALMKSKTRQTIREAAGSRTLRTVQAHFPNVESVDDGRDDVVVEVTKRDCSKAARKNHNACALARACEHMVGVDGAIISRSTAFLVAGRTALRYLLSSAAAREIVSFDRGAGFTPGEYILKAPTPSQAMGSRPLKGARGRKTAAPRRVRRNVATKGIRAALAGASR